MFVNRTTVGLLEDLDHLFKDVWIRLFFLHPKLIVVFTPSRPNNINQETALESILTGPSYQFSQGATAQGDISRTIMLNKTLAKVSWE